MTIRRALLSVYDKTGIAAFARELSNLGVELLASGGTAQALASITARVLSMPCETDLYFPIGDFRYEARFITGVTLTPIPSLWGHSAGSGGNPVDNQFINDQVAAFLSHGTR